MADNDCFPKKIESATGDIGIIGENTQVSMQLMQSIYNEITGKTEEISQGYKNPYQVKLDDFIQLNAKITQLEEQYSICAKNTNITIYYLKDTKEVFSSFERFLAYDSSRLSPIESVIFKYDFMIKLPNTKKLQPYTLSIRIGSKITMIEKIKKDVPPGMPFIQYFVGNHAMVTINYIDYIVARTFQDGIKEWVEGLDEDKNAAHIRPIQSISEYIPRITKYSLFAIALYYAYSFSNILSFNMTILAKYILLSSSVVFISYRIGNRLGRFAEDGIDNMLDLSYVSLNKGDEREIRKAMRRNRFEILKIVVGILGSIAIGIFSSYIANRYLQ